MSFRIERNDITKVHTEAIVNTANPMPTIGSGTDAAVYTAAGVDLLLGERKKIGVIDRGEAAWTPAFRLLETNGIRYIIHTVGILWKGGDQGETEIMRNCYRNSLRVAKELNCKSISIPLLATGNYGFPKETALHIALDEISQFLFENEMEVVLVVYDKESFKVSNKIFDGIQSFINENYIGQKKDINNGSEIRSFYLDRESYRRREEEQEEYFSYESDPAEKSLLADGNALSEENVRSGENADEEGKPAGDNRNALSEENPADDKNPAVASEKQITPIRSISIDDYVQQNKGGLNFQELLRKHIIDKGLDNPTVYKRSIIVDKKLFSKIINGHIPGKHSVMALGLALELNIEEYETFLATANYALNPAEMFDIVVQYCVKNKVYNVMEVDAYLFEHDLPCFNEKA